MTSIQLAGIRIDDVNQAEATRLILGHCRSAEPPLHVVTANPEFVMQAQGDPDFRRIIAGAGLVLPDGVGLLWGARMTGQRLRGRATGVETIATVAAAATSAGPSLYLLGGAPGVAEAAADALRRSNPQLRITGTAAGSPGAAEAPALIAAISAARPDVLLVAFGAPEQDLWIARYLDQLPVRVAIGVGGAFDFLAGVVPRAPAAVRRAGLEWAFRLARQPWRWRRQTRLPLFLWLMLRQRADAKGNKIREGR